MEFEDISDEDMAKIFNEMSNQSHKKQQKEVVYTELPEQQKSSKKRVSPERKIDLHGMRVHEALNHVEQFIKNCHLDRIQFALIITGKGRHSAEQGSEGVLKKNVRNWLENHHITFQDAPRRLGGQGAFWIKFY